MQVLLRYISALNSPSMNMQNMPPHHDDQSSVQDCPGSRCIETKIGLKRDRNPTRPLARYTKDPPDQTALQSCKFNVPAV